MQKSQRFNLVTHTGIKCVSNIKYKKSVQTFHFVQIFFIFYATFIRFIMMYILFFWGGGGFLHEHDIRKPKFHFTCNET